MHEPLHEPTRDPRHEPTRRPTNESTREPTRLPARQRRAPPPDRRRRARIGTASAGLLAAAAIAAGCATRPAPPTEVSGVLQAAADLNPSVSRRPSPLLVRVYELKSAAAFDHADFVALYERDQAALGAEMVGREEYVLNPGDSKTFVKVCGPETRYLGVVGAYRELDRARWRSVVPLQAHRAQQVVIRADALSITATATAAATAK